MPTLNLSVALPDALLALLAALTLAACARYAGLQRNYVVAALCLPLAQLFIVYMALVFDVEPFESSLAARQGVIRPALAGLLFGLLVFLLDGRINRWIDLLLGRARDKWRVIGKRFSR